MSKWESFSGGNQSSKDLYVAHFKLNMESFLSRDHDPKGEKNQPANIVNDAKKSLGSLSRIFDSFDFPVPNYDDSSQNVYADLDKLHENMQEKINGLLPLLLNDTKNGISGRVINAIGKDNYNDILKQDDVDEQAVAISFLKALCLSYGQRVLDTIPSKQTEVKIQAFNELNPFFEKMANSLTLSGLPDKPKDTRTLDGMKLAVGSFLDAIYDAKNLNMGSCGKQLDKIIDDLMAAEVYIEMGLMNKTIEYYEQAQGSFIKLAVKMKDEDLSKPKVNWFVKVLRVIVQNEKILQSTDEKRYDKQMELLPILNNLQNDFSKKHSIGNTKEASIDEDSTAENSSSPTLKN